MSERHRTETLPRWQRPTEVDRYAQALAELYPSSQRSTADWIEECEAMQHAWTPPARPVSVRGNGVDLLLALLDVA